MDWVEALSYLELLAIIVPAAAVLDNGAKGLSVVCSFLTLTIIMAFF